MSGLQAGMDSRGDSYQALQGRSFVPEGSIRRQTGRRTCVPLVVWKDFQEEEGPGWAWQRGAGGWRWPGMWGGEAV